MLLLARLPIEQVIKNFEEHAESLPGVWILIVLFIVLLISISK